MVIFMGLYCSKCKETIQSDEYKYSKEKYGKILCRNCQKDSSKEPSKIMPKVKDTPKATHVARTLCDALIKRGIRAELEKDDGYKHIDIAVTKAKLNIEVDGGHHNYSSEQALADLKRTLFSLKKGFQTLRIPNSLIREELNETVVLVVGIVNANEAMKRKR